ncbi:ankyrin [Aspergillus sclerotioniger CBS 115572]|uniref:Ankyrin n=1 Tax=Aspergillus sclerotioniger CBS 115572 TaxID=1450535 RepID=A0A317VFC3_9EURO|nr:ankyrin [Aspergillus sclerotioniger CBS 115572]PWY71797.1 ankyrin [Aspergillus sclerotioniger CBS 115572]
MPLLSLSPEILCMIIARLGPSQDTNNLIRTCWRLYDTYNISLYKAQIHQDGGHRVFLYAAQTGEEGAMQWLCQASTAATQPLMQVGVNILDPVYHLAPLAWAAIKGHESVVKLLLQIEGIAVDPYGSRFRTPLSYAAENGFAGIVRVLLAAGADANRRDEVMGRSPLHWAGSPRLSEDARSLHGRRRHDALLRKAKGSAFCRLEVYFAPDMVRTSFAQKDWHGHEILFPNPSCSAGAAYEEILESLIEYGANLESRDGWYYSPLGWAAVCGYQAVVELLLRKGARLTDCSDIHSPFLCAAQYGYSGILQILLDQAGAGVICDDRLSRVLRRAAQGGHEEVVKLVLRHTHHRLVDPQNPGSWAPLVDAAKHGHEGTVSILLEAHTQKWPGEPIGPMPAFWAADSGHTAVLQVLHATGIDINEPSSFYDMMSPLHAAVRNRHAMTVEFLLHTGGVGVNTPDELGWTAFSWAAPFTRSPIRSLLLDVGADKSFGNRMDSIDTPHRISRRDERGSSMVHIPDLPISFH